MKNATLYLGILVALFAIPQTSALAQEKTPAPGKVLLDNDRVKVSETRVKPGEKNAMKMREDRVTVPLTNAKFRFHYPDGKIEDVEYKTGTPIYRDKGISQAEMLERPKAAVSLLT